ncbi:hypothetical protein M2145_001025 [Lachnospiraceae bacterium PF1-21]|uniref:hypothetical protein n=1 Tax=Ohessyouella blattaphilus TaxID=2949333 RepID=UPI003E1B32A7
MKSLAEDKFEILLGGIFGLIALIAIVVEVIFGGVTVGSVAGGIKDMAGIMVAILVFLFAVRNLFSRKDKEDFESVLNHELEDWEERNSPVITKASDFPDANSPSQKGFRARYYLLTNMEKIVSDDSAKEDPSLESLKERNSKNTGTLNGRFVDIPREFVNSKNKNVIFYLNKSTFQLRAMLDAKKTKDEWKTYEDRNTTVDNTLKGLSATVANSINNKFRENFVATAGKDSVSVSLLEGIKVDANAAREIVKMIDHVFLLYAIMS